MLAQRTGLSALIESRNGRVTRKVVRRPFQGLRAKSLSSYCRQVEGSLLWFLKASTVLQPVFLQGSGVSSWQGGGFSLSSPQLCVINQEE